MDRVDPNQRDNQRRSRHQKPYVPGGSAICPLGAVVAQPLAGARLQDTIKVEVLASPEAVRLAYNCGYGKNSGDTP